MSKTVKFTLVTIWLLLTRSYDAYCTYQYTPDLSHEANPLVSILGFGWSPLLLTLSLLGIYIIYAYYQATFKPYDLLPQEPDYSFSHFIGYIYTGKKQSWVALLYQFPSDRIRFRHYTGHLMTRCLAFAGFVSTVMWLLLNYSEFYPPIHTAKLIYGILFVGNIIISIHWYRQMYQQYHEYHHKLAS